MSLATIIYRAPGRGEAEPEASEAHVSYRGSEPFAELDSVRIHAAEPSRKQAIGKELQPRVMRRFRGFFIESQGFDAKVAFVVDGHTVPYYIPAKQLMKAGIASQNQPFQMDEVEIQTADEGYIVGYRFMPLAQPSDAFVDVLKLDTERERKRDLIFRKFGKAQD